MLPKSSSSRVPDLSDLSPRGECSDFLIAYEERHAKIWAEYVHMRDVATHLVFFQLECAPVFMQINKLDGEEDCSLRKFVIFRYLGACSNLMFFQV